MTEEDMIKFVAENGGEYIYTTVKGEITDIEYIPE